MLMETSMMASGQIIFLRVMENILGVMVEDMRGNGKMTRKRETE